MSETPQRVESEITSQTRLTPEQKAEIEQAKAARRLEVTDILSKVKGLSEEEVSRMVRAI
jgi:Spy/CpxP family protein refolding chaperone